MPSKDPWNEVALIELTTREPFEILKASVQLMGLLKSRGVMPPENLRQSLLDLPNHSGKDLESRSGRISLQILEVLTDSQAPARIPSENGSCAGGLRLCARAQPVLSALAGIP